MTQKKKKKPEEEEEEEEEEERLIPPRIPSPSASLPVLYHSSSFNNHPEKERRRERERDSLFYSFPIKTEDGGAERRKKRQLINCHGGQAAL